MGGIGKALGKVLDVVKPFLSMVNPLLGAAAGLAGGLLQGKDPLQSIMGAVGDMIPGGNVLGNALGAFGGSGLMDGAGGNSLIGTALNFATGKGKVSDIVGSLTKSAGKDGLSPLGQNNAMELAAQAMSRVFE